MRIGTLLVVGLVAGALLGALFPSRSVQAATFLSLYVHPGASTTMNCGWHGDCTPNEQTSGRGIDWDESESTGPVFWRSFGIRSDTGSPNPIGTGQISQDSIGCIAVIVDVVDSLAVPRGSISFTHAEQNGDYATSFPIYASSGSSWTSTAVGDTLLPVDAGCSITGEHLHEVDDGSWTVNWSRYPNWYQPINPSYSITTSGYHQFERHWQWN